MKWNSRINKITKIICFIIVIFLITFLIVSGFIIQSGKKTKSIIEDFKNRGELVYVYEGIEYYKVKKEHEYEDTSNRIYSTSSVLDDSKTFTDKKNRNNWRCIYNIK